MPEFITAATKEDYREARTLLREYEVDVEVDLCFRGRRTVHGVGVGEGFKLTHCQDRI